MIVKESCRYVRSYSELEGLQRAHTLCYSARRTETGIVLELALEEGGVRSAYRALCPSENFPRAHAADEIPVRKRRRGGAVARCAERLRTAVRQTAHIENDPDSPNCGTGPPICGICMIYAVKLLT